MSFQCSPPHGWRDYQKSIRRKARSKRLLGRMSLLFLFSGSLFVLVLLVAYGGNRLYVHLSEASYAPPASRPEPNPVTEKSSFPDLWPLVSARIEDSSDLENHFYIQDGDTPLMVHTTINPALQNYIHRIIDSSGTEKSAVVVLDPNDGRILAMASQRKNGDGNDNLCLKAAFPAASLFKIISAAAAIEKANFTPDKTVSFAGRAHTLYKSQLTERPNRFTCRIPFRRAFARSINPVFGKLGVYTLGRKVIIEYARKFFFDRPKLFRFPVAPSTVEIPTDSFELAELACGFNRETRISPLHAAILASAVANGGVAMTPWVIKEITDGSKPVYAAAPSILGVPIKPKTARDLQVLMGDTVRYGTCRTSFRRIRRKKDFKSMLMGAKTGTINDRSERYKYDWTTAYAVPKDHSGGICVAVLEVHGKILGTRSQEIARAIISYASSLDL